MSERPRTMTAEREKDIRSHFSLRSSPYEKWILAELDAERAVQDTSAKIILELREEAAIWKEVARRHAWRDPEGAFDAVRTIQRLEEELAQARANSDRSSGKDPA